MQAKRMLAVAIVAAMSGAVMAADDGAWEPVIGVGKTNWDSDRHYDDKKLGYLGIGYHLNSEWVIEPFLWSTNTSFDTNSRDFDANTLGVKGLYFFGDKASKVAPYATLGVATLDTVKAADDMRSDSDVGAVLGLGARIALTERLGLRIEFNSTRYTDNSTNDMMGFLGLSYAFGGAAKPAPVAEPAPVAPAPAPVVEQPKDSDGDGVYDDKDQCPNTPAGRKVDEKGCEKVLEKKVSIRINVKFDSDKSVVKPEFHAEIKKVADFMKEYDGTKVVIEGHTDSTASDAYNQSLSERRAKAVAESLIKDHGIDASRVSSVGHGEAKPIADNASKDGRAQNRRVVAEIEEFTVRVNP